MDGLAVSMVRAASEMGQLFGSVTSRDIANAVTEAGFTLGRSQVIMETAIKTLGLHDIRVRLHPEVTLTVVVNVARSLDEAETQLKTGVAVTGMIDDDDDDDYRAGDAAVAEEAAAAEAAASDEAASEDAASDETASYDAGDDAASEDAASEDGAES